jgi:hypothetical protein
MAMALIDLEHSFYQEPKDGCTDGNDKYQMAAPQSHGCKPK